MNSPKEYFQVEEEAHFRARPDLIEELGLPDQILAMLPRDPKAHAAWLARSCGTARDLPLAALQPHLSGPYRPTKRYTLKSPVPAGGRRRLNLVTDGNLWPFVAEPGGLFDFVLFRAREFAVAKGMTPEKAGACLNLDSLREPSARGRAPAWAIGYECGTGLCILLDLSYRDTERNFLPKGSDCWLALELWP